MDSRLHEHTAMSETQGWKTVEYHGKHIHVSTAPRIHENTALSGPGRQWEFTVRITAIGTDPDTDTAVIVNSDPALAYSTQAIAEDMGFIKGRESISGI